jgi:hypothetical protein
MALFYWKCQEVSLVEKISIHFGKQDEKTRSL